MVSAAALSSGAEIELRAEAESAGPFVVLSEVARLEGGNPSEMERLARLPLGLAPKGSERTLTREYVACRLRQAGFEGEWLTGADTVKVKPGREGGGRAGVLSDAVREHIAALYGLSADDVVVELGKLFDAGESKWDSGVEVKVTEPSSASESVPGSLTVIAEVKTAAGNAVKVSVPVKVSVWEEVFVAKKNIPRRGTILASDVESKRVLMTEKGSGPARSLSDIVGRRAERAIPKGSVVALGAVEELPLVERGDVVTAEVRGELFSILTYAKAKESGKKGEVIEVENPRSRQVYLARVIGKNTVEVSE